MVPIATPIISRPAVAAIALQAPRISIPFFQSDWHCFGVVMGSRSPELHERLLSARSRQAHQNEIRVGSVAFLPKRLHRAPSNQPDPLKRPMRRFAWVLVTLGL